MTGDGFTDPLGWPGVDWATPPPLTGRTMSGPDTAPAGDPPCAATSSPSSPPPSSPPPSSPPHPRRPVTTPAGTAPAAAADRNAAWRAQAARYAESGHAALMGQASRVLVLLDELARVEALLHRCIDEKRIRHDHGYPMEVGPHRCAGCDLIDDLRAAVAADPDTTEAERG